MSLTKVDSFQVSNNRGYKVFQKKNDKLFPEFYSFHDSQFIANNVRDVDQIKFHHWYKSKNLIMHETGLYDMRTYRPGFHLFIKYEDALSWIKMSKFDLTNKTIAEVEFEDIITSGYQYSFKTLVTDKIKILKETLKK